MNAATQFLKRLAILFGRKRFRNELDEEMAFHRAEVAREFATAGMTPEEARYAAVRRLGNATQMKERSHEVVEFSFESVVRDLRYAVRQLILNPGFTAVMILTLALSIGANSAIFSVIEGVLLKPLPYPHAEQIVRLFLSNSSFPKFPLNPFDFRDFRARNKSFESMAAFTRGDAQLSGSGEPVQFSGFGITSGFFHVLGLKPELGREFDQKAEITGNGLQVILSDRLVAYAIRCGGGYRGTQDHAGHEALHGGWRDAAGHGTSRQILPFTAVRRERGRVVALRVPGRSGESAGSHYVEGIGRLKNGVTPHRHMPR